MDPSTRDTLRKQNEVIEKLLSLHNEMHEEIKHLRTLVIAHEGQAIANNTQIELLTERLHLFREQTRLLQERHLLHIQLLAQHSEN